MGAGASSDLTLEQFQVLKEHYEKARIDAGENDQQVLASIKQELQKVLSMNSETKAGAPSPTRSAEVPTRLPPPASLAAAAEEGSEEEKSGGGSDDEEKGGGGGDLTTLAGMVEALDLDDVDLDEDIEELDLSEKGLTCVPSAVFLCGSSLTGLYLENNELSNVNGDWAALDSLEELYLRKNQVAALPEALAEGCQALDSIYLEDNRMTEEGFPENFGELPALKGLTLHRNCLNAIPPSFFSLTTLEELYLDHNNISVLPEEIGQLTQLREIGLIGNRLEEIPRSFGNLTALTILHAEDNQLSVLPKTMGQLQKLKGLYLQNNRLPKLISSIGRCQALVTINVENNKMKGVAKRIGQLPRLKYLLLASNELTELPFNPLETAPGLRRLTLSGNQLSAEVMKLEKMEAMGEEEEKE